MEINNDKKIFKALGGLILVVVIFCAGFVFGDLKHKLDVAKGDNDFTIFWNVWNTIKDEYVDSSKVDEESMYYGAIKGMVDAIGDVATLYLDPTETEEFNKSISGKTFTGIGAELGYDNGQISVISPIDGSPAQKAGILAGDIILKVDGEEIKTTDSIYDVVAKIRGEAGTKVTLTVLHKNASKVVDITITRGEIDVPSIEVSAAKSNKDVAVIRVSRFTDESVSEWNKNWDKAVAEALKINPKVIVLDLRGNPGGYFDSAVYAANEFLDKNTIVAKQEDKNGEMTVFRVTRNGKLRNIPVAVLVNGSSASASEILSGALQQNERAKIFGEKTYGKGTAQTIISFDDGSTLHLTILKWLLPDGSWISKENPITPDYIVEYTEENMKKGEDTQMNKALEIILK